jgi:Na+/H+ antiporter NhaC
VEPGPSSLLPPLIALAVAVGTRRVLLSLGAAVWAGATLLAAPQVGWLMAPLVGAIDVVRGGLLGQVAVAGQAQVLLLIGLVSAFVHLLETSGAGAALVASVGRSVRGPRAAEGLTWLIAVGFFFSDIGHVLIVGPMCRPLFDRVGLPRERLAWIVDTTAAPLSVLIPIAAWGVYLMGLFESAFSGADPAAVERVLPGRWHGDGVDGFGVWLDVLPRQLYPWLSLCFVPLMIGVGRPFGPMARARAAPAVASGPEAPQVAASAAWLALAALMVVLLAVGASEVAARGAIDGAGVRTSLACAYLAATAVLVARLRRDAPALDLPAIAARGAARVAPVLLVLVLAWALGDVCERLGTGAFLAVQLAGDLPPAAIAPVVFVLAALTSFATGTSWGTFAVWVPVTAQLCVALDAPAALPLAAVLSGGVFGDHASPISDTTLLASLGADVDHADHVATQLPYALTVAGGALVGFAVVGVTGSLWGASAGLAVVVAVALLSRVVGARGQA